MTQPQYSPPPTGGGPSGPRASFGQRLGAWLIDFGIVLVVSIVFNLALKQVGGLIAFVLAVGYFTYFEGGPTGQTIGKRAVGIRVYDFARGGPIGYPRGLGRYFARWLSAIPCFLGYFWMLWDGEKQCWHDKLCTDVVVPVSSYPVQR
jgi:uncharacterized RDD family membrane protein YckC